MIPKLRFWLPQALVVTLLCGLIFAVNQQNLRQSANDPQIQISEETASNLSNNPNHPLTIIPNNDPDNQNITKEDQTIDLSKSLAPFTIIFNSFGQPISSTAKLNGQTPIPPKGVLDYAKNHRQNKITWEPQKGVRLAIVVTYFTEKNSGSPLDTGFVLAGRSLREVEKRENNLLYMIGLGWIATLTLSLISTLIFLPNKRK